MGVVLLVSAWRTRQIKTVWVFAWNRSWISASREAAEPSSRGLPLGPSCQFSSANLLGALEAKTLTVSNCSVPRMLMPRWLEENRAEYVLEVFWTQTSTRGGSRETEQYELAASPLGVSPSLVVTTVTPVMNWRLKDFIRSGSSSGKSSPSGTGVAMPRRGL